MAEYIEREALLTTFDIAAPNVMADYGPDYGVDWGFSRDAAKRLIKLTPAADVAPVVHGRWEVSDTPCERFKCSECGGGCWYYDYQGDVAKSRYCPNCGAKMDKEVSDGLEDS